MSAYSIAHGISASQTAADAQQTTDAMSVIMSVMIVSALQSSCQNLLDADKYNVFLTSINLDPSSYDPNRKNPDGSPEPYLQIATGEKAGYMAAYQETYQTDGAITDTEISDRQTDLQTLKQQTSTDGDVMTNTDKLIDPIDQVFQLIVHEIAGWAGAGKG